MKGPKGLAKPPYVSSADWIKSAMPHQLETWGKSFRGDPMAVVRILAEAGHARAEYVRRRRAAYTPDQSPFLKDRGQRLRRLLDQVLKALNEQALDDQVPSKSDQVLRQAVEKYIGEHPWRKAVERLPAHHPGVPWLRPFVLQLTELASTKRAPKAIHDALVIAGHGDVVTRETVRRMIGEAREELATRQRERRAAHYPADALP